MQVNKLLKNYLKGKFIIKIIIVNANNFTFRKYLESFKIKTLN